MFLLRFDMRAPTWGPASSETLYETALDMAAWAEEQGGIQLVISEHHGVEDGYLPSPLILAAAMAARTKQIAIQVAALVVPLHDPIELAEQMAVLDLLSQGRISYVVAVGYRPEEYAMFGRDFGTRGKRLEESLDTMRKAWSGESFDYEGRPNLVRPLPRTPGGPTLLMGGHSAAAARRAARLGLGMIGGGTNPDLHALYHDACQALGKAPGLFVDPPPGAITAGFVAEDPDQAWVEMGPHLLHDAQQYAKWMGPDQARITGQLADSVEQLKANQGIYRIMTPQEAIQYVQDNGIFVAMPLCGGLPPDLAWPSLELLTQRVLPAVQKGS